MVKTSVTHRHHSPVPLSFTIRRRLVLTQLNGVVPPQGLAEHVAQAVRGHGGLDELSARLQVVDVDGGPRCHVAHHHHQDHRQRLEEVFVAYVHPVGLAGLELR